MGESISNATIHSISSIIGECFAVGSLIQAVVALLALKNNSIPLGKCYEYRLRSSNSRFNADRLKEEKISAILVHAMNFDGTTGALIVER
jgi:3-oxoacyl-(acyl-carrier-protein) synthase